MAVGDANIPSDIIGEEIGNKKAVDLIRPSHSFGAALENLRAANSPAERAAAARALGLIGSQHATAHLIAAMFDDDPEVRSAAEEALKLIGRQRATAHLTAAMLDDDPEVRSAAEKALKLIGGDEPTAGGGLVDATGMPIEGRMGEVSGTVGNVANDFVHIRREINEFEQLSAKTAGILQEAALAHERIAKDQEEIEQLKMQTRAMLTSLRAA
jgi:HEAT repeat protein